MCCYTVVGQILNLRFSSNFSTIMWSPPQTADGLSYQLTVINKITSQVIVSTTTTHTKYSLPPVLPCQDYLANVTTTSSKHQDDSAVTVQRSPGGKLYTQIALIDNDIIVAIDTCFRIL